MGHWQDISARDRPSANEATQSSRAKAEGPNTSLINPPKECGIGDSSSPCTWWGRGDAGPAPCPHMPATQEAPLLQESVALPGLRAVRPNTSAHSPFCLADTYYASSRRSFAGAGARERPVILVYRSSLNWKCIAAREGFNCSTDRAEIIGPQTPLCRATHATAKVAG